MDPSGPGSQPVTRSFLAREHVSAAEILDTRAELPKSWSRTRLGELSTFVTSGSRGWAQYYAASGAAFVRIGNLDHGTIELDLADVQRVQPPHSAEATRTCVSPGDILVSITADLGMIGVVPERIEEAYINQHIALVRTTAAVDSEFVAWYLASESGGQEQFRRMKRGATKIGLGLDDIRSVTVPVAPPNEQHRIVAEIEKQFSRLDAGAAALKRVQANLKRYRAAMLQAACEGRLVPTEAELARAEGREYEGGPEILERVLCERRELWNKVPTGRSGYPEPASPDAVHLPQLSEGWIWATLEQLTDERRAITYGVVKLGERTQGGVPTLRSSNVRHLWLDLSEVKHIAAEIAGQYRRTFLVGGEVLVTVRGTLGGVVHVPDGCAGYNISREVAMIAPVDPRLAPVISYFLAAPMQQGWLMRNTKGIAYTGINIETLKAMPMPLPPLAEQRRIVEEIEQRLSIIKGIQETVEANLKRCERLRQAILKQAFEGKLVPQDPSDEPAGVLLERIRAERVASSGNGSTRVGTRKGKQAGAQLALEIGANSGASSGAVGGDGSA